MSKFSDVEDRLRRFNMPGLWQIGLFIVLLLMALQAFGIYTAPAPVMGVLELITAILVLIGR